MIKRTLVAFAHLLIVTLIVTGIGCEDSGGGGGGGGDVGENNDANLVICMGDSITEGEGLTTSTTYPAQLAAKTGKSVNNSGQGGARSSAGLSLVGSVLERNPGYILILYGVNDLIFGVEKSAIVANLRGIVQAAKANETVPIVGLLTPTFPFHDFVRGDIEALNPMIKDMAREEGVPVADLFRALDDQTLFQSDGLHPNAAGAERIAATFAGKL